MDSTLYIIPRTLQPRALGIIYRVESMDSRYKYRLYGESMEIRDLETRGPWAVASERSEDATKGPRV